MNEMDNISGSWDSQFIVKGHTTTSNATVAMLPSYAWLGSFGLEAYKPGQPKAAVLDELEKDSPPNDIDNVVISVDDYAKISPTQEQKQKSTMGRSIIRGRRNKRKINVVRQAAGDHVLSDDKWNWRKYGEKAIKSSPYRRSYYKCSSSGGCLARKQVEQSNNEPGIFLISYIDEHNHPYPTKRHPQAGVNVRRCTSTAKLLTKDESIGMSARTSIQDLSIIEEQVLAQQGYKDDGSVENMGSECINVPSMDWEEDFFAGLEYLESIQMDLLTHD